MTRRQGTRQAILKVSEQIVRSKGFAALTFEAIAQRLGVTKQAVIYWFPTKEDLVREIVGPALEAEAQATIAALDGATDAADAVARFVRALVAHHLANLGRFRIMYLAFQLSPRPDLLLTQDAIMSRVRPATSRMYGTLEEKFAVDPRLPPALHPRRSAVVVHMAALGLITMVALADSIDDRLAHRTDDLVDSMIDLLCLGARV